MSVSFKPDGLYEPPEQCDVTVCKIRDQHMVKDVDGNEIPAYTVENLHRADKLAQVVVEQGRRIRSLEATVQALLKQQENK